MNDHRSTPMAMRARRATVCGARLVRGARRTALACGLLAGIALASGAQAQTIDFYASYGPVDPGPGGGAIGLGNTVDQWVYLWAFEGANASSATPCDPAATGDEICGISFMLDATGTGFELGSFEGNASFDTSGTESWAQMAEGVAILRANMFDLGAAPTGSRYLGRVRVSASGMDGGNESSYRLRVTGRGVGSNLEMIDITAYDFVVPEPGLPIGVLPAALLLAGQARLRRARR